MEAMALTAIVAGCVWAAMMLGTGLYHCLVAMEDFWVWMRLRRNYRKLYWFIERR